MPIYEYKCPDCGAIKLDIRSKESRNVPDFCKICRKDMPKILSPSSFKVNGFNESNGYSKCDKGG